MEKGKSGSIGTGGAGDWPDEEKAVYGTVYRTKETAASRTGTDPHILFLDEPTAGLDVEGRRALHDEIRSLASRGKTVVLASHDMAEVEELCSRILILNQGRVTFLGTVEELVEYMGKRYRIKIRTVEGEEEYPADNLEETLLRILQEYKEKHVPIQDIQIGRGTLEEHFIELAKEGV